MSMKLLLDGINQRHKKVFFWSTKDLPCFLFFSTALWWLQLITLWKIKQSHYSRPLLSIWIMFRLLPWFGCACWTGYFLDSSPERDTLRLSAVCDWTNFFSSLILKSFSLTYLSFSFRISIFLSSYSFLV